MKKLLVLGLCCIICFSVICFSGCNKDVIDTHLTLNYAIVQQNGKRVLHRVHKWSDSESESVCIRTECCDDYIWFSVNNGELYKNKPNRSLYDYECGCVYEK